MIARFRRQRGDDLITMHGALDALIMPHEWAAKDVERHASHMTIELSHLLYADYSRQFSIFRAHFRDSGDWRDASSLPHRAET